MFIRLIILLTKSIKFCVRIISETLQASIWILIEARLKARNGGSALPVSSPMNRKLQSRIYTAELPVANAP